MNPATKLAAFALVLGIALGGGAAVGQAVGPIDPASDRMDDDMDRHEPQQSPTAAGASHEGIDEALPTGVLISQAGYSLDADSTALDGTPSAPFSFRILGPEGAVAREFVERHERELHLILVGADLGTYAHLHPSRGDDGTWTVALPALAAGAYRVFADFAVADGPELTLGVDVMVSGDAQFAPLPPVSGTAAVDGYELTLEGAPVAGAEAELAVTVSRDGEPVTDLEPYLGAFGHLVAIRGGDLAYLHVHPLGDEPDAGAAGGPTVRFAVHVPSPGDYRLFFDFSHGGSVHTAAFTTVVPAGNGHA